MANGFYDDVVGIGFNFKENSELIDLQLPSVAHLVQGTLSPCSGLQFRVSTFGCDVNTCLTFSRTACRSKGRIPRNSSRALTASSTVNLAMSSSLPASYRSSSAAMMFKLPSTATTSLSMRPGMMCGKTAKWMYDGGRQRAR